MTAGSMCSTKIGSWEGRKRIRLIVRQSHSTLPRIIINCLFEAFVHHGTRCIQVPRDKCDFAAFSHFGVVHMREKWDKSQPGRQRLSAMFSGMIFWHHRAHFYFWRGVVVESL